MTHDFDLFNLTFFRFGEYLAGFDVFFWGCGFHL